MLLQLLGAERNLSTGEAWRSGSLIQIREPLPRVGPGDVLVRIRATALNARDLSVMRGRYPIAAKPGLSPLSDAAGEIVEIGEGVRRFSVGDKVVNSFYPQWFGGPLRNRSVQFLTTLDGWLSTYKVISAESLSRMPEHMSFEEGATLPCSGVTGWSALSGIGAGDTVLTQGSGGVSLFAIQIARLRGARVIATTTSAHKTNKLKELGAEYVMGMLRETAAYRIGRRPIAKPLNHVCQNRQATRGPIRRCGAWSAQETIFLATDRLPSCEAAHASGARSQV